MVCVCVCVRVHTCARVCVCVCRLSKTPWLWCVCLRKTKVALCVCFCVCVWSVTSECLKRECHGDGGTWWGGHRVGGWVSERPQRKRGLGWWLISGEAMSLSSPDGKLFDVLMSNTHACTHMYTTHTHTHVHYTHTSTQTHMCTHTHTYTHKGTYLCEWTHIRYFHIHAPLIHTVETQLHTHMYATLYTLSLSLTHTHHPQKYIRWDSSACLCLYWQSGISGL